MYLSYFVSKSNSNLEVTRLLIKGLPNFYNIKGIHSFRNSHLKKTPPALTTGSEYINQLINAILMPLVNFNAHTTMLLRPNQNDIEIQKSSFIVLMVAAFLHPNLYSAGCPSQSLACRP